MQPKELNLTKIQIDRWKTTFGSPCDANTVRRKSNGYVPNVAVHPATAPLKKDSAGFKWM